MRWAAALAALLLLLPMVGPLVDHHFAERLPYHEHLFLDGRANASHTHLAGRPHTHTRPDVPRTEASRSWPPNPFDPFGDANAVDLPSAPGDVLFLAAHDGWTPPAYSAATISVLSGIAILLSLIAATWRFYSRPIFAYRVDLPPPKHPPRRSLLSLVSIM